MSITGVTTYAHYRQQDTPAETTIQSPVVSSSEPQATKPTSSTPVTAEQPVPATPSTPPTATPSTTPTAPVTPPPTRRTSTPPQTTPVFTAGQLITSLPCYTGMYAYTLDSASVSVNVKTFQSFSWQIELNNGIIHQQGTSSIPYDSTVWLDFPNTPGFPSPFNRVYDPSDGLSARFVITAPNYSAGAWSTPVPIGSKASCHAASS